jgi:hypothetical protein
MAIVVVEAVITGDAPAGPQLQVIDLRQRFHKILLRHPPAQGSGREHPPLGIAAEAGRAIAEDAGRGQVALVEIVLQAPKVREEHVLGFARKVIGRAGNIGRRIQGGDNIVLKAAGAAQLVGMEPAEVIGHACQTCEVMHLSQ